MVRHPLVHVFKRLVRPIGTTRDLTNVAVKTGRGKRVAVNLLTVNITFYSKDTLAAQLFEGVMEPTDPSKEINKFEPAIIHNPSVLEPPRESWRLQPLRGWSNVKTWEVSDGVT